MNWIWYEMATIHDDATSAVIHFMETIFRQLLFIVHKYDL